MKSTKNKKTPSKIFADQLENEEVLLVFRKHPVVMRKGLILGMFCLLLGTIPSLIKPEYSFFIEGLLAGCVLGIIVYSPWWISWFYTVFIVTDHRFIQITQKGLFHRSVVDIGINQIQMVNYEINGLQETLLGFGTIIIQTYMGDLIIHDVHHPAKTQQAILSILRDNGIVPVMPLARGDADIDEVIAE
jgi:uncharacterized membrane protein YdbT with pleckstrin-like domain